MFCLDWSDRAVLELGLCLHNDVCHDSSELLAITGPGQKGVQGDHDSEDADERRLTLETFGGG